MNRRNLSLDDVASAALDAQIAHDGEASAFVCGLLAMAELDRALALAAVRAAGWRPSEMAAACQALSGTSGFGLAVRAGGVASNLALVGMPDAQRAAWLSRWGIDLETWGTRCAAVAADDELAAAITVLSRLFWADDAVVVAAVAG